jgi:uncharacterized membrane protein YsdA (DUF1294 family)
MQNIYIKTTLYVGILLLILWGLAYAFLPFTDSSFLLKVSYLTAINLTTFIVYIFDKEEAEENSSYRVPEKILHALEAMGGSIFAIFAQHSLHHKSSKVSFFIVTWLILVIQISAIHLCLWKTGLVLLLFIVLFEKFVKDILLFLIGFSFLIFIVSSFFYIAKVLYDSKIDTETKSSQIVFHKTTLEIKNIQQILKSHHYYSDKIDGIIGKNFREAIKKFQKNNGLKVDGIVGNRTYKKLMELRESTTTSPNR